MSAHVSLILVLFDLSALYLNFWCLSKWAHEYLGIEDTRSSDSNPFPSVQTNVL